MGQWKQYIPLISKYETEKHFGVGLGPRKKHRFVVHINQNF